MDKLSYYVLQTDRMLPKYLGDVVEHSVHLLTDSTMKALDTSTLSAGVSSDDEERDSSNNDDNDDESDGDDAESVESEDSGAEGDNVQQVLT